MKVHFSRHGNIYANNFMPVGVPTYLVIDKEGGIIYKTEGFPGVDVMKILLIMNGCLFPTSS
ncbi:MAG: hypothetical protein RRY36_04825 [Bacteroidaceae bacterium]